MLLRVSACIQWDCKRNLWLHEASTSASFLSSPRFLSLHFFFLYSVFRFPSHTFFFFIIETRERSFWSLRKRKEEEKRSRRRSGLLAAFLSVFLLFLRLASSLALWKHSRNLSTGVSHSSSNCGAVKTIIVERSSFFYFARFFPPQKSFSDLTNFFLHYRVICAKDNKKKEKSEDKEKWSRKNRER